MNKAGKQNRNENSKGTVIFTVTMVLCAVLLFLVSDKGANFISGIYGENTQAQQQEEPTGEKEEEEEIILKLPNHKDMMKDMVAKLGAPKIKVIYSDIGKTEYSLKYSGMETQFTFTLGDGETAEIVFSYVPVEEPETKDGEMTPIEEYAAKKERAQYENSAGYLREIIYAMLMCINGDDEKGLDTWLNLLDGAVQTAADSGKINTFDMLGYGTKVYPQGKKEERKVFISISLQ